MSLSPYIRSLPIPAPARQDPQQECAFQEISVSHDMQGIKVTDAASKKKARDTLEAEAALRKMDVESNVDWEEAGSDAEEMED